MPLISTRNKRFKAQRECQIVVFSRPMEIIEYDFLPPDRIERLLPDLVEIDRKIEHT